MYLLRFTRPTFVNVLFSPPQAIKQRSMDLFSVSYSKLQGESRISGKHYDIVEELDTIEVGT